MASTVYTIERIALSDGVELDVRPLPIKYLRVFNETVKGLQNEKDEDKVVDILINAGLVCMRVFRPELADDQEKFEEIIDIPTLLKILEVAGGLNLGGGVEDPNLSELVGMN